MSFKINGLNRPAAISGRNTGKTSDKSFGSPFFQSRTNGLQRFATSDSLRLGYCSTWHGISQTGSYSAGNTHTAKPSTTFNMNLNALKSKSKPNSKMQSSTDCPSMNESSSDSTKAVRVTDKSQPKPKSAGKTSVKQ